MFKEKAVLHVLNLAGLAKIGGSFSAWISTKSGYALILFIVAAVWLVTSNIAWSRAKRRYPRFGRACAKFRM